MRDSIEELFRMYKVEPDEALIEALVLYVKHEQLNAIHKFVMDFAISKIGPGGELDEH